MRNTRYNHAKTAGESETRVGESQTLMIVSRRDLERVVRDVVSELLAEREESRETFLSAAETARRLGVDRTTLWRWNRDGFLLATKVGSKVRYKLADVERLQRGEVMQEDGV